MVRRRNQDDEFDHDDDGPSGLWRGLNEAGRLALSLSIILDMLGIPNDNGIVMDMNRLSLEERFEPGRLEFYQALWVQFRKPRPALCASSCLMSGRADGLVCLLRRPEPRPAASAGDAVRQVHESQCVGQPQADVRRLAHAPHDGPRHSGKSLVSAPLGVATRTTQHADQCSIASLARGFTAANPQP